MKHELYILILLLTSRYLESLTIVFRSRIQIFPINLFCLEFSNDFILCIDSLNVFSVFLMLFFLSFLLSFFEGNINRDLYAFVSGSLYTINFKVFCPLPLFNSWFFSVVSYPSVRNAFSLNLFWFLFLELLKPFYYNEITIIYLYLKYYYYWN